MSSPQVKAQQTNYKQQLTQTLAGLQATAPGYYGLNSTYAPKYTDLNLNTLAQTLFGDANAPGQLQTQAQAQTFGIGRNIADVNRFGAPGYQALLASNPGLAQSLGNANAQGAAMFAPNSLLSQLQATGQQQLALGGSLSPQELAMADQATRAGFADRGMLNGNQALGAELLNRDALMQQRLGQRIGYANQIQGATQSANQYANQLASMNAGIYDPYQTLLGRGSSALASLGGGGGRGTDALMGTLNTQNLFNPQQGQDAFNTNVNAQNAAAIANANNSSASTNGLIGAGASIAGAALMGALAFSDDRLKKNVKLIGRSPSGIPVKEFEYKDGTGRKFVGAMADDVERIRPSAVVPTLTGHRMVDYAQIDAPFYEVPTLIPRRPKGSAPSTPGAALIGRADLLNVDRKAA